MTPTDFIASLVKHWPVRFDGERAEAEWLGEMVSGIRHYDGAVLERAAERIRNTRKDRRFPLLAEIRTVCQEFVELDRASKLPLHGRNETAPIWSEGRKDFADSLMRADRRTSRQAADEGWILGLRNFVIANGRMPNDAEISQLKRAAVDFDDCFERASRGEYGEHGARLARTIGVAMLARREALKNLLTG